MHELGITQNIVEIAERTARQEQASRVLSVTVEVGTLAGVVVEAMEFCFEACTNGTLLEGAQLRIDTIPARARCRNCASEYAFDDPLACCPTCKAFGGELLSGEELRIREMEID